MSKSGGNAEAGASGPSPVGGATPFPVDQVTPRAKMALRLTGGVTVCMVVLAFLFCLVRGGSVNPTYYLLACNLVISSFVGLVNAWWYRSGALSIEKHWYIFLVCLVILVQCITTDIYVFHPAPGNHPTPHPPELTTVHAHINLTTHTHLTTTHKQDH